MKWRQSEKTDGKLCHCIKNTVLIFYLLDIRMQYMTGLEAARNVLAQEQFAQDGGEGTVASWRNTATIRNVHPNTTVAFRMNNLSGSASDLTLYAYGADGKLVKVAPELWSITDENRRGCDRADGRRAL